MVRAVAEIRYCPFWRVIRNSPREVTARAPTAPPSRLSKKFTELVIPTIQIIVIATSKIELLVGLPTLSDKIRSDG